MNNNESKTFSVTMTEEELKLFSEFLEQRDYSMMSAAKTMKRRVVRAIKPTPSQKAAAKRHSVYKANKNWNDPHWHEERRREIFSPYGVEIPSNYMV